MSLLVSGFNCFGQFTVSVEAKQKFLQFEEIYLKNIISNDDSEHNAHDDNNLIISCTWSYLCLAKGNVLHVRGFLSDQPNLSRAITTDYPIKALATNDRFCLILFENGKLFKLLPTMDAVLQEIIFTADRQLLPQKRSIFGEPKSIEPIKIAWVGCGNNVTAAISTTNIVFSGTTQIHQFPQYVHVKMLQCGFEHSAILTKNGDIYTWGNGLRGQLGQDILRTEEYPTLLEALSGIKIVCIATGGWHMAALSIFGDLYTWGFNTNGQLGIILYKYDTNLCQRIKQPSVYPLPQVIDLPICECCTSTKGSESRGNCTPIKVVAGARHTLILNDCGNIYGSGWNGHGQLGLASKEDFCDQFQFIFKIDNIKNISQICCGDWCTIIIK